MSSFEDRNKSFENKFAHDKELDFKVQARMTKLLARWAAAKMGMAEVDAKTYASTMVEADMQTPGTEDVVQMLMQDFAKAGISVTETTIRNEMEKQFALAREQLLAGKQSVPRNFLQLQLNLSQQLSQSLRCLPSWVITLTLWSHATWQKFRPQQRADVPLQITDRSHHLRKALSQEDDTFRHISFTFALIALAARIACADGPLTKDKYIAFRESFPLGGSICGKIRQLFTLACTDQTPTDHYINQIKYMYPDKPELYISVLERLFRIASADGYTGEQAQQLLTDITQKINLPPECLTDIRTTHEQSTRAYVVLGVAPETSSSTLKKRYHELMRLYHPDRYATEELSDEVRLLLRAKTTQINAAYRTLSKKAA